MNNWTSGKPTKPGKYWCAFKTAYYEEVQEIKIESLKHFNSYELCVIGYNQTWRLSDQVYNYIVCHMEIVVPEFPTNY